MIFLGKITNAKADAKPRTAEIAISLRPIHVRRPRPRRLAGSGPLAKSPAHDERYWRTKVTIVKCENGDKLTDERDEASSFRIAVERTPRPFELSSCNLLVPG